MINQFNQKKIKQHLEHCHTSAMAFIEIVTNTAISQMQIEGKNVGPEDLNPIDPEALGRYAAKGLGVDAEQLILDYTAMLVFEGMVIQVQEIHHYHERGM